MASDDTHQQRHRLRFLALAALVSGAVLALLSATQVWVRANLAISGLPAVVVEPTGRTLVPVVAAVGLLALGAAVATLLVGQLGRVLMGVAVAVLAAGAAFAAFRVAADPAMAVAAALAEAAGVSDLPSSGGAVTAVSNAWPQVAGIAMVIVACAATIAAVASPQVWPRGGRRYAATETSAERGREDGVGLWDALDRGDDPTA